MRKMLAAGLLLLAACDPGTTSTLPLVAPRVVLFSYDIQPTTADSARLAAMAGGVVTFYPLIKAMAATTPLPVAAFDVLTPKPGAVTDFAALRCAMDLELTITPAFSAADSTFLKTSGFKNVYVSHRDGFVDLDVTPANFALINAIAGLQHVSGATLYTGCIFAG